MHLWVGPGAVNRSACGNLRTIRWIRTTVTRKSTPRFSPRKKTMKVMLPSLLLIGRPPDLRTEAAAVEEEVEGAEAAEMEEVDTSPCSKRVDNSSRTGMY